MTPIWHHNNDVWTFKRTLPEIMPFLDHYKFVGSKRRDCPDHITVQKPFTTTIWFKQRCMNCMSQELCTRLCSPVGVLLWYHFRLDISDLFTHIRQGCLAGSGTIVQLPRCTRSDPNEYGYNWPVSNHNKTKQSTSTAHIYGCIRICFTQL